jgi:SPP1 gp7 family putative phage head morphogenesis protein
MNWGAHKADVRIATNNARKIQAALRQGIDAKRVIVAYRRTQPNTSKNPTADRARARAWAMLNMRINNEPLLEILQKTWADGFVLGQAYGDEAIARAREAKKAGSSDYIDWDHWKPGDAATATLLRPPKAFQELLGRARVTIKDLDQTGYDRVGTALADSIEQGLSDTRAARLINDAIGNPARALSIAITETNRAMSQGAINRYQAAKLEQMEWATSDPCPTCAMNSGQVINIGGTFNSGANMPPAHPHCRCAILPVIPEFEPNANGVVDIAPATGDSMPYDWNPALKPGAFQFDPDEFAKANKELPQIAQSEVKIRAGETALQSIIADGRIKTAHEVEKNFGGYSPIDSTYRNLRTKLENQTWGIPENAVQPIYGYIDTPGFINKPDVKAYGNVSIVLKDKIKNRVTFTVGDSLNDKLVPVQITKAAKNEITNKELSSAVQRQGEWNPQKAAYLEAQIHGGVSVYDIERVEFVGFKPLQKTIDDLQKLQIEVKFE